MVYAILASIFWEIDYYVYGKLSKNFSYAQLMILYTPIFIFFFALGAKDLPKIDVLQKNFLHIVIYLSAQVLASISIYYAMKNHDPFFSTIFEIFYPVVILLLMIFFKEETFSIQKFFGITLAISGIYLCTK